MPPGVDEVIEGPTPGSVRVEPAPQNRNSQVAGNRMSGKSDSERRVWLLLPADDLLSELPIRQ